MEADIRRLIEERRKLPQPTKIGYLSGFYEQGEVPEGFVDKLLVVQESALHNLTIGHHTCEYCFPGGDDEILAKAKHGNFEFQEIIKEVWSSGDYHSEKFQWSDMLRHYIVSHKYLPPQEFIDAMMIYQPKDSITSKPELKLPDFDF